MLGINYPTLAVSNAIVMRLTVVQITWVSIDGLTDPGI